MNWGTGLAITMIAFVIFIGSFVYGTTQNRFHLVSKNYYEEALVFDDVQINRSNFTKLKEPFSVKVNRPNQNIELRLPASFANKKVQGTLHLYNPANGNEDQFIEFNTINFIAETKNLSTGLWRIKVDWQSNNTNYRYEQSVVL